MNTYIYDPEGTHRAIAGHTGVVAYHINHSHFPFQAEQMLMSQGQVGPFSSIQSRKLRD